jgi:hypothetical protein
VVGFLHALIETTASVERTREWRELAQSFEAQLSLYMAESEHTWQLSPDVMLMLDTELHVRPGQSGLASVVGLDGWAANAGSAAGADPPGRAYRNQAGPDGADAGHDAPPFEARMRQGEGHYCWLRWHAVPGRGAAMLIGRNITEERQSVQRMARSGGT